MYSFNYLPAEDLYPIVPPLYFPCFLPSMTPSSSGGWQLVTVTGYGHVGRSGHRLIRTSEPTGTWADPHSGTDRHMGRSAQRDQPAHRRRPRPHPPAGRTGDTPEISHCTRSATLLLYRYSVFVSVLSGNADGGPYTTSVAISDPGGRAPLWRTDAGPGARRTQDRGHAGRGTGGTPDAGPGARRTQDRGHAGHRTASTPDTGMLGTPDGRRGPGRGG
jgi:hypothetical protein